MDTAVAQQLTTAPIVIPPLNDGEIWIGIVSVGVKLHHVILPPGDNDEADWNAQMAWAKSLGGDLPSRVEQAMLFAETKSAFKRDLYWSNEQHASYSGSAWCQHFGTGGQDYGNTIITLRARAVRRVPIQ